MNFSCRKPGSRASVTVVGPWRAVAAMFEPRASCAVIASRPLPIASNRLWWVPSPYATAP
jgi:hypothetical protein